MKRSDTSGFTLIEVMMVVLIFSIMLSFIAINSNFSLNEKTKLKNDASNLYAKIKLAKQEAIFQHTTLKLEYTNHSFNFSRLQTVNNKHEWKALTNNSLLNDTQIDKSILVEQNKPLMLYPNGTFSEFTILLKTKDNKSGFTISSSDGTNIRFLQNGKP